MACHHMGLLMLYGKDGGYDVEKVSLVPNSFLSPFPFDPSP